MSSQGNQYIMVLCESDCNCIDVELMKDWMTKLLSKTYLALWNWLVVTKVIWPKMHILNKAPVELKAVVQAKCKLQLVLADTHRHNVAKWAMQTFKNHSLANVMGVDPSFSMNLWDWLIPQMVLTLNLLHQLSVSPGVSAYAFLHGQFDCNAMPLESLGYAMHVHEATNRWKTWSKYSLERWYSGTWKEHYSAHMTYTQKTRSCEITTLFFQAYYTPNSDPDRYYCQSIPRVGKSITRQEQIHWPGKFGGTQVNGTQDDSHGTNTSHSSWHIQWGTSTSGYKTNPWVTMSSPAAWETKSKNSLTMPSPRVEVDPEATLLAKVVVSPKKKNALLQNLIFGSTGPV